MKKQYGFSTIEILIALTLMILVMSAVTLVTFGNQSVSADSETNTEALHQGQMMMEKAIQTSRASFDSVSSYSQNYSSGINYTMNLLINSAPCGKQATTTVAWLGDHNRSEKVTLNSLLTNIPEAVRLGGNCATTPPPADGWRHPTTLNSIDFTPGGVPATSVAVMNKNVFMTGAASAPSKPDFYIYDSNSVSLTQPPILKKALDTGPGLNFVVVMYDTASGNYYAYVANNDKNTQLQVIKIPKSDLTTASLVACASMCSLNTHGVPATDPAPEGQTIFYYDHKIYLGLQQTTGPEFHVFDVSSPESPSWLNSYNLGGDVNQIVVKYYATLNKTLAFLATSGVPHHVVVLDVTNPSSGISFVTSRDFAGSEKVNAISINGNILFAGRSQSGSPSEPDIIALDIIDPVNSGLPVLGNYYLNAHDVNALAAVGKFLFVGTNDSNNSFVVLDVSNLSSISSWSDVFNYSQITKGLVYENNLVYTANRSNDALRVVYSP